MRWPQLDSDVDALIKCSPKTNIYNNFTLFICFPPSETLQEEGAELSHETSTISSSRSISSSTWFVCIGARELAGDGHARLQADRPTAHSVRCACAKADNESSSLIDTVSTRHNNAVAMLCAARASNEITQRFTPSRRGKARLRHSRH